MAKYMYGNWRIKEEKKKPKKNWKNYNHNASKKPEFGGYWEEEKEIGNGKTASAVNKFL